jgi:hypothetical protein
VNNAPVDQLADVNSSDAEHPANSPDPSFESAQRSQPDFLINQPLLAPRIRELEQDHVIVWRLPARPARRKTTFNNVVVNTNLHDLPGFPMSIMLILDGIHFRGSHAGLDGIV